MSIDFIAASPLVPGSLLLRPVLVGVALVAAVFHVETGAVLLPMDRLVGDDPRVIDERVEGCLLHDATGSVQNADGNERVPVIADVGLADAGETIDARIVDVGSKNEAVFALTNDDVQRQSGSVEHVNGSTVSHCRNSSDAKTSRV